MSSPLDAARDCRRLEERLRVLSEATRAFSEATVDAERLLDVVARRVAEVVRDYCLVLLVSEDGLSLRPAAQFDPDPDALRRLEDLFSEPFLLADHPIGRRVHETGEPLFAPVLDHELSRPPRSSARIFAFLQDTGIHSMLVVALRVHDRSIGQLVLARFRPESAAFDEHDLAMAQSLADCAALAVQSARLLAESRREERARAELAERLRTLEEASREFSTTTSDYQLLLDVVARRLGELVGEMCVIRAVSEDGLWLESTGAVYHRDPALLVLTREVMLSSRQRVGEGISGRVAASGQAVLTPRISTADFVVSSEPRYRTYLERLGVTSSMTIPLVCRGKIVGIANLMRSDPAHPYVEDDLRWVESVANHAALAIGNARSYAAERVARAAAEKATAALRQAESRFARLRDAGIIGIVVANFEYRILEINDVLLGWIGYSRDEILSGRVAWGSLTPPEWQHIDERAIDQLAATGIGNLREKEYIHKDGRRVPVLTGSAVLEGETSEIISFVLDLTESKNARALIEQMRARNAVEARLAAIVDSSDDAIFGSTPEGVVTTWNRGAERMLGYSAEEAVGRSLTEFLLPSREGEREPASAVLEKGDVPHLDTVRRRKDGRDIHLSVTRSPVYDTTGRVVGISNVARDITERRDAEVELSRAKDIAEAASRELEAFGYSVAHDLRAPLRGMNGFAAALLEDHADELDADGRDCLEEIRSNGRKMNALIDGLLALAHVAKGDWRPERIDLSALVRAAVAELAAAEPERKVTVVVEDHVFAEMDLVLARALFQNLVGNAWKFTANVPDARIEFGATDRDGTVTLWVRDNGAGFDMAYASKLFAPFQRLHSVREFPGTGIGLATVQRIVRRHGGRVWAEGEVGRGASFYFTLPRASQGAG